MFTPAPGLKVSLAGAEQKLAQLDAEQTQRATVTNLEMPTFRQITGRDSDGLA
ncbi:hypothetical protein [Streptomyces sp. 4N124]|uniref:hypothetical protein n=1 Tax=Streptomyces sp. 4N124 TaxID=3457420 RepID=UPI003FCF0322